MQISARCFWNFSLACSLSLGIKTEENCQYKGVRWALRIFCLSKSERMQRKVSMMRQEQLLPRLWLACADLDPDFRDWRLEELNHKLVWPTSSRPPPLQLPHRLGARGSTKFNENSLPLPPQKVYVHYTFIVCTCTRGKYKRDGAELSLTMFTLLCFLALDIITVWIS